MDKLKYPLWVIAILWVAIIGVDKFKLAKGAVPAIPMVPAPNTQPAPNPVPQEQGQLPPAASPSPSTPEEEPDVSEPKNRKRPNIRPSIPRRGGSCPTCPGGSVSSGNGGCGGCGRI